MGDYLLNSQMLSAILCKSRTDAQKTQRYMARALGKSVPTIQNWESGYTTIDVLQFQAWFEVLGVNPLRYILAFTYPDPFYVIKVGDEDNKIDEALHQYFTDVATPSEKRKLAYCIFGNTGSSWHSQLEMLTAHNHCSLRTRVNVAQAIYNSYLMEDSQNALIKQDYIAPNLNVLKSAIDSGMESVLRGNKGYMRSGESPS